MNKWFWIVLVLIVGGLIGIFVLFNGKDEPAATNTNQNPQEITAQDHTKGNAEAKVTLVEYGDFQCPACGAAEPLVQQLNTEFKDRLRFVFRHFPISAIHPNAFAGARAAEAAGKQGKFFEMHDLLYARQNDWSTSTNAQKLFRDYAHELGLDANQFNDDYNNSGTNDRINSDIKLGQGVGVSGTPTFFINGQKLEPNPNNYEQFKAKIEEALLQAGA